MIVWVFLGEWVYLDKDLIIFVILLFCEMIVIIFLINKEKIMIDKCLLLFSVLMIYFLII